MKLLEVESQTEGGPQESTRDREKVNEEYNFEHKKSNMFRAIFFMILAGMCGLGQGTIFKSVKRNEGTNLIDFFFLRSFMMTVFCILLIYL